MKNNTRIIALCLCISVVFFSCPLYVKGEADPVLSIFDSGSGTAADPYKIKTGEQLTAFASAVNGGNSFSGEYISLTRDIELNDVGLENWHPTADDWTPIGLSSSAPFKGIFNGQGFAVRGLYNRSGELGGLFGYINSAEIKNLVLLDVFIDCDNAGGIAVNLSDSKITGCKSFGRINGEKAAGIAGFVSNSSITGCTNNAEISGSEAAGGISYYLVGNSSIVSCINHGSISSERLGAGLVAENLSTVKLCRNTGFVFSSEFAAGIASQNKGEIQNSSNHGDILSDDTGGGICAYNSGGISNCYNAGAVEARNFAGGIAATCISSTSVLINYNVGYISGDGSKGAISAINGGKSFASCYYLDSSVAGGAGTPGTALTGAQMQNRNNFAGFDFMYVWKAGTASSEYKYPTLLSAPSFTRAASVSFSENEIQIKAGETIKLTATVMPSNASSAYVRFYTEDGEILSVGQDGTVKGLNEGLSTVYVLSADGGYRDSCTVTVSPRSIPLEGIRLNKSLLPLNIGESERLICELLPEESEETEITWVSDKMDVAGVSSDGIVTALKEGKAVIVASAMGGAITASCTVTVTKPYVPVTGVTISPEYMELDENTRYGYLTAAIFPPDATNKKVQWISSNPLVAAVDEDGRVMAVSAGEVNIIALTECGQHTASCTVKVKPLIKNVTSVTVSPSQLLLTAGEQKRLTVSILPEDATDKTVYWFSDKPQIVSVNQEGEITALSEGSAIVSAVAQDGGITGYSNITVMAAPVFVNGVIINQSSISLLTDESYQLSAKVSPEDADNKAVIWSSSDPSVASVDQSGKVTGKTAGTAGIIVKTVDGGFTDTCTVTVTQREKSVSSVKLNKNALALFPGDKETLIATVLPADATNKKVVWSSGNIAVASVSQSGVVTAVKAGTATIKVVTEDKGYSATCTVVVTDINAVKPKITLLAGSEYKVNSDSKVLYNIKPGTKVAGLLIGLSEGNYELRTPAGKLLGKDAVVTTGTSISLISNGEVADSLVLSVLGDVNGDGLVTASDARMTLRFVAKLDTPKEPERLSADVNGKGVSAADARIILRVVAKLQTL